MALQPVHHVSTIAPSHACHTVGIDIAQLGQCVGCQHHVLIHLATPVAADGSAIGLTASCGAVWIGIGHNISCARIYLPVGTERIHPLHLRSTVHVHHQRIALVGVEVVRLDDEDFHAVASRSLDPQLLARAEVNLGLEGVVVVRELGGAFLLGLIAIERIGLTRGAAGEVEVALRVGQRCTGSHIGHLTGNLACGQRQLVDGHIASHIGSEINLAAVLAPSKIFDPIVKTGRDNARCTVLAVIESEFEAVALITRCGLATIGDIASVRAVERGSIPSLISSSDIPCFAPVNAHQPQVGIGRCLGVAVMVGHIAQLTAVGRESEQSVAAGGEQQGLIAGSQVAHHTSVQVTQHQVSHAAIRILRPVTIEQTVGDVCLHTACVLLVAAVDSALCIGTKLGVHLGRESHKASVWRNDAIGHTQLVGGELARLLRLQSISKHLHGRVGSHVEVVDFSPICAPCRSVTILPCDNVGGTSAIVLGNDDATVALKRLQASVACAVDQLLAIGREAHTAHTGDAVNVRNCDGTLLCRCAQAGDGRQSDENGFLHIFVICLVIHVSEMGRVANSFSTRRGTAYRSRSASATQK